MVPRVPTVVAERRARVVVCIVVRFVLGPQDLDGNDNTGASFMLLSRVDVSALVAYEGAGP